MTTPAVVDNNNAAVQSAAAAPAAAATTTTTPHYEGNKPPGLLSQLGTLIKKDFRILRRHRKEYLSQILVPLLSAVIASQVFSQMLTQSPNQPGYTGYTTSACGYGTQLFVTPKMGFNESYTCWQQYNTGGGGFYSPEQTNWMLGNLSSSIIGDPDGMFVGIDGNNFINSKTGAINEKDGEITLYYNEFIGGWSGTYLAAALYPTLFAVNNYSGKNTSNVQILNRYFSTMGLPTKVFTATIVGLILGGISLLPATMSSAARLVDEKRTKMREHLKVMGVTTTSYVLAALVWAGLRMVLTVTVQTVMFAGITMIKYTEVTFAQWLGVWLVTLVLAFSLACFSHLPQVLVSRPNMSNAIVTIFVVASAVGANWITLLPDAAQWALALFLSPVAGSFAIASVLAGENLDLPVPLGASVIFMALAGVGYLIVGEYLMALFPGEYGVPRTWDFPIQDLKEFLSSFGGNSNNNDLMKATTTDTMQDLLIDPRDQQQYSPTENDGQQNQQQQQQRRRGPPRIVVKNLTKFYGSQRDTAAVNQLTFHVNEGEVFVILGPNGAGKSSAIACLMGMISPTSYDTATICGLDLNRQMNNIRYHIGVCPQFDILFDDLSGPEHVEFFAEIRGAPVARGRELLQVLDLPLTDQVSSTFSGGMKRRLSAANAFCGQPQVLFLDEISAGLDVHTRSKVHDAIIAERERGTSIILTSHHLAEVELLADRILIMSHGKRYAEGTNNELKAQYGVGYFLSLVRKEQRRVTEGGTAGATGRVSTSNNRRNTNNNNNNDDDDEQVAHNNNDAAEEMSNSAINLPGLLARIQKHCPGATLHSATVTEVTLLLPMTTLPNFGPMLAELEQELDSFGFSSFGLTPNSLEDVFVSIATKEEERRQREKEEKKQRGKNTKESPAVPEQIVDGVPVTTPTTPAPAAVVETPNLRDFMIAGRKAGDIFDDATRRDSSLKRFFLHIWAICLLRLRYALRSPRMLLLSGLVPFILIGVGVAALIPMNGNGSSQNYVWHPVPVKMPDVMNQQIPFVYFRASSNSKVDSTEFRKIIATFRSIYLQQWPGANLDTPVISRSDWDNMAYKTTDSMAFTEFLRNPNQAFFFDSLSLTESQSATIIVCNQCSNYYSSDNTQPSGAFPMITQLMLQQAVLAVMPPTADSLSFSTYAADAVPVPAPRIIYKQAMLLFNETTTTTATTTTVGSTTTTTTTTAPTTTPAPPGQNPASFIVLPFSVLCALAIVQFSCSNALYVAEDLNKGSLEVMRLSGLQGMSYWLGCLLFDLIWFMLPLLAFIVGPIIRGVPQLTATGIMVPNCFALLLAVTATSLISFIIVRLMPRGLPNGSYLTVMTIANMLLFALPFTILGIVALTVNQMPEWTSSALPYFTALRSFSNSLTETDPTVTEMKHPAKIFVCLVSWNVGLLFILQVITQQVAWRRWFDKKFGNKKSDSGNSNNGGGGLLSGAAATYDSTIDEDVRNEIVRIEREIANPSPNSTDLLVASHVRKVYEATYTAMRAAEAASGGGGDDSNAGGGGTPTLWDYCKAICHPKVDKVAVADISVSLREGNILAILGQNASGKSTTVRQLMLEEMPTSGKIYRYTEAGGGEDEFLLLPTQDHCFWKTRFAIVTQHDSLFDNLTADEHLDLYLAIRLGSYYNRSDWAEYRRAALNLVTLLDDAASKSSSQFSGGMKRKLQAAIAVACGGNISCLDELSTGVDAHARRSLYGAMKQAVAYKGCASLLVTHYLDEAESVATTICILRAGLMCCIGSAQHLRTRFGSGYTVTVTLDEAKLKERSLSLDDAKAAVDTKLKALLPRLEIAGGRGNDRVFTLAQGAAAPPLSAVFNALAQVKDELLLHSYAVAQTSSLEQIFIKFSGGARAGVDE